MNIDEKIETLFQPISELITSIIFGSFSAFETNIPFIVVWLVFASLFFTFYFNFVNLRFFNRAIMVARGKFDKPSDPGEVSHFQSFTAAMSGTIGLGNIAGVAVAISIGGPGATLWMIITAFFGMTLKFVEVSLGHRYRIIHEDGTVSGGAIRYLSRGLEECGYKKFGKILAFFLLFVVLAVLLEAEICFKQTKLFSKLLRLLVQRIVFFRAKVGWLG